MPWCSCGTFNKDGVDECVECGKPVFKKDRKFFDAGAERQRYLEDKLRTADHERKKFNLEPRKLDESVKDYCLRIDREKTNKMIPVREREPGEDDDKE